MSCSLSLALSLSSIRADSVDAGDVHPVVGQRKRQPTGAHTQFDDVAAGGNVDEQRHGVNDARPRRAHRCHTHRRSDRHRLPRRSHSRPRVNQRHDSNDVRISHATLSSQRGHSHAGSAAVIQLRRAVGWVRSSFSTCKRVATGSGGTGSAQGVRREELRAPGS